VPPAEDIPNSFIDPGFCVSTKIAQGLHEVLTTLAVIDDPGLFNPPEHNVVKSSWSNESRSAGAEPPSGFLILE
jgi:hypothetical protein